MNNTSGSSGGRWTEVGCIGHASRQILRRYLDTRVDMRRWYRADIGGDNDVCHRVAARTSLFLECTHKELKVRGATYV